MQTVEEKNHQAQARSRALKEIQRANPDLFRALYKDECRKANVPLGQKQRPLGMSTRDVQIFRNRARTRATKILIDQDPAGFKARVAEARQALGITIRPRSSSEKPRPWTGRATSKMVSQVLRNLSVIADSVSALNVNGYLATDDEVEGIDQTLRALRRLQKSLVANRIAEKMNTQAEAAEAATALAVAAFPIATTFLIDPRNQTSIDTVDISCATISTADANEG